MSANIDHDCLFEEFILLFFPKVYEDLDLQNLRFLSEELVTDVTKDEKYRIDLLVETNI
ncbi:hypothetical protein [Bacillus sp. S3]|uniref:hypothetical protein n=1 Tax=Bacillus sp. S3 TaxID=486398 RepID=UPI0016811C09